MERAAARDRMDAFVLRNGLYHEEAHARGVYEANCERPIFQAGRGGIVRRRLMWQDVIHNVVTIVGRNLALDTYLAGAGYTVVGPFLGLISSVGYTPLAGSISAGTYTGATGAVSLTTAAPHNLNPGDSFTLSSMTGTGSYTALNSTFIAGVGTSGSTIAFFIVPNLTMTITGGTLAGLGTKESDTMVSHSGWFEVDAGSHFPTVAARLTTNTHWNAAASGSKALSAALAFTIITNAGTLKGCFLVYGTGAVATLGDTNGTLYSAGMFAAGDKIVGVSDIVNVSFTASI